MLPDRIARAAAAAVEATPPLKSRPATGKTGEIAVGSASGNDERRRIVVVMSRQDDSRTADILLATSDTDMATDLDLVLLPDESGLPFQLMVESELYGPVFSEQLTESLAHLTDELRVAVGSALASDGESLDRFRTGTPLVGDGDLRRAFKSDELEDLNAIVEECRSWLAGEPSQVSILDPALLIPPPTASPRGAAEGQYLDLLDILGEAGEQELEFPSELVTLMGMGGLLDEISRWRIDFGLDVARILGRFRFTERQGRLEGDDVDDALTGFVRFMASTGSRTVDVHSTPRCWRRVRKMLVIESERGACRARVLLREAA